MVRRRGHMVLKLEHALAEYADLSTGPVVCLLGGVDENGNSGQVYVDDPAVARALSVNLFEWAIREELRRKYNGS